MFVRCGAQARAALIGVFTSDGPLKGVDEIRPLFQAMIAETLHDVDTDQERK
jgi:hypothetical protein